MNSPDGEVVDGEWGGAEEAAGDEPWADGDGWAEGQAQPGDAEADEAPDIAGEAEPAAKRRRKAQMLPRQRVEDLEPGATVLYYDGWRGIIRDAFIPLDEFWVADEQSGELVRDDKGDIIQFKSSDLTIVAPPPVAVKISSDTDTPAGSVMLMGGEKSMMKILEHFGAPGSEERNNPQQLLAIPCHMCDPANLLAVASEGVSEEVLNLGKRLREDLHVGVRAYHLKQTVEQLGADFLRLEDFFCLAAVQLPYSWEDIEMADISENEKHRRKEVCNQVDLCPTATGQYPDEFTTEAAARRALGTTCGVEVSDVLWDEKVQQRLRRKLKVNIPTKFVDERGAELTAVILPQDAIVTSVRGVLCFSEAPGALYTQEPAAKDEDGPGASFVAPAKGQGKGKDKAAASDKEEPVRGGKPDTAEVKEEERIQGKTVAEWETEQAQFADEPELPEGWIRIRSRHKDQVYYFHRKTQKSQFEFPDALPPGWTKQVSKSSGKTYYFHAKKKISQFVRPTA